MYRLVVTEVRDAQEHRDAQFWTAALLERPELLTGYRVITHRSASPCRDPVAWRLEASDDGVAWTGIDQVHAADVTRRRGTPTAVFDDLPHLTGATRSFRYAFLL